MTTRDEKRHRYAALMLSHRQEWQRYAHNQTKLAIRKDKSVVRTAFTSTSSPEAAMKRIEAYHKGPSIKVWENVFKAVWLETGHAAAEFMHEYLTGKSVNLTADIQHKGEDIRTLVWKDPVVDTVLSSWDSRVDDKIMNGGFKDKIEGINSTTEDKIHSTIQEGVANGDSHYTIGQNVESHLDETWAKRGETISRTETNSAMNAATREDMKATAPDLWKTWSIAGNNTRPWHEEVDGESIPQDEMFTVDGEEMEGPGDDSASPGNVVNCECTQLAEEPPAGTPVSDEEQARIDEAALAQEGTTTEGSASEWTDVASNAEANAYLEDNGIVELASAIRGVDQDVANIYGQTLADMYSEKEKWGLQELRAIGMNARDGVVATTDTTIIGDNVSFDLKLQGYMKTDADWAEHFKWTSELVNGGTRQVVGSLSMDDVEANTIIHELGHVSFGSLTDAQKIEFYRIWETEDTKWQLLETVSNYSLKNDREGFAENFLLYVKGEKDRIPKDILAYLTELYG